MKESVDLLKNAFGIDHLSNNELFIIKKITEDVLNRAVREMSREICTRFLLEAYGIDPNYINYLKRIAKNKEDKEKDKEGFLEYIRRTRERAHLI